MASSSKPERIYDVFLSFRGTDLRNNFISHLYKVLDQNGIYTFVDSEELKKGDQMSPALIKAIEQSGIILIVFSEDYASSHWCLEELAKIMECKEQADLIVLPVFYKVDPRDVRGGTESYGRALSKHESMFGKDSEKVKRWKKALFDAGSLSGWHLNNGDESEFIQRIVKGISTQLDRTPLHVAKYPVGIDSQVVKLKSMLNLKSNDILMVGLWGQGGIGKTALAKALYNSIHREFMGSCFLANIRETSKRCKGLVTLQEILLKDILLLQQRLEVSNVDGGIKMIQQRLRWKKVLLVIDDVDDLGQLNALVGKCEWFGKGSRIIITTRDKHLLTCHGIYQDHVYEVKALGNSEAHELLSKHAFLTNHKLKIRTDLMDSVLNNTGGLPLALEVIGSFLCGRREHEWESAINKLSKIPNKTINDVLKISYDGLEKNEREIFLHIACFFKGWDSEYVKKVLYSCNLEASIGLEILIERSLIKMEYGFEGIILLQVHDLIQLMGMDIANQECYDDPKRRSRLWLYNDVLDVISSDKGDCAVKAIVLEPAEMKEMYIGPDDLTKMKGLRLLIMRNVHNSFQGPTCLPNELRWFQWAGYAPEFPEFSSGPKKLVGLDMREGNNIPVEPNQYKDFQYLKYINFSHCKSLVRMPDLSCTPNLEELDLRSCKNLIEAHESIACHDKLQVLNLRECSKLSVFPNVLKSKKLRALDLCDCKKFESFPEIPHKLEALKELRLRGTAIKELPLSIENLVSLETMYLNFCKNLVSLPSSIYKLRNLESLLVEHCTNLIGLPENEDSPDSCMKSIPSNIRRLDLCGCNLSEAEFLKNLSFFPFLRELSVSKNSITSLPTPINSHKQMPRLNVRKCHQLPENPELPPLLNYLLADGHEFVRRGLTTADISPLNQDLHYSICLSGEEMPEWILPVEEDFISFMASEDLYDKFIGFALYVILGNDEQGNGLPFELVPRVNGERRNDYVPYWRPFELNSDFIWLDYFRSHELWGVVNFGQIDQSYVQFSLTIVGRTLKKWGFRIICKRLEDDLKAVLQDNQLIDLALLYEVDYKSTDPKTQSSLMHKDSSREADPQEDSEDCQTSAEDRSQIGSKRKHEFILPQGKRIKMILTSSSTDEDENVLRMIDQLKNLQL